MKIKVNSFGGLSLGIAAHLLPENGAQEAVDVCFDKGDLRAWRKPLQKATFTSTYDSTVQYLATDDKRVVYGNKLYHCTADTTDPAGTFDPSCWTVIDPKSLFRFEENSNDHWIMSDADRDYVRTPIPDDAYERVYFSGETELRGYCNDLVSTPFDPWGDYYKVGVPAPTTAPTLGSYTTGGMAYRAYFYIYTNKYGAEGAFSPISGLTDYTSGNVTLSDFVEPPSGHALESGVIQIYRTNASDADTTAFQYVGEFNISGFNFTTGTFVDDVTDANLGEVATSRYYDVPPDGMTNLKLFKSDILVGIADNKLCFSVPGFPHAWPDTSTYRKSIPSNAKGFGIYGSNIYVLTDDFYYTYYGDTPEDMGRAQSGAKFPCASKRSIFELNNGIGFAGYEGLMLLNQNGCTNITKKQIFGVLDWIDLNPGTIHGNYYNGKYFFFYIDDESVRHGMMLDMTGDYKLTSLSLQAYDCFWDYGDGKFYMLLTEDNLYKADTEVFIKEWNADPYNYLKYEWKGRKNLLPNKMFFRVGKCFLDTAYYDEVISNAIENDYLVDLNASIFAGHHQSNPSDYLLDNNSDYVLDQQGNRIGTAIYGTDLISGALNDEEINELEINGDNLYSPSSLSIDSNIEFRVYLDTTLVHTETINSNDIFTLNTLIKGDVVELFISGYVPIYNMAISASAQEMITT